MTHKVIVVGAGVVGASIAYNLTKQCANVTMLEKSAPASQASSKSFSWINSNFPKTQNYFDLRCRSIEEHHNLQSELAEEVGYKWGGGLWWEYGGNQFEAHLNRLKTFGYPFKRINKQQFIELEPLIKNAPDQSVLFTEEGQVDSTALTFALVNQTKRLGGKVINGCEVKNLLINRDSCIGVITNLGDFYADTVVVAMGINAAAFLARASTTLPMKNLPGLIVHTEQTEPVLQHLMLSPQVHFRQQSNGTILAAQDYGGNLIEGDIIEAAQKVLQNMSHYLPIAKKLSIAEITLGIRPMPMDGYPVIGNIDNLPGVYIASMHSGVTLAPIVGKFASTEILENRNERALSPYRLSRFSSKYLS